ncbi:hypothetical protein IF1G_10840 [Cordyceps javanica]|uniref:Uncharacterized protein n=1 Tax=Cordyceps javanica TaxID=43265 RepID=A0A545UM49_9HYPO|nr:hypothetical protein IF1G_10840 [Cordyceps javanica]
MRECHLKASAHGSTPTPLQPRNIYSRIAESKRELCEGQSAMQAFANQLDEHGFWIKLWRCLFRARSRPADRVCPLSSPKPLLALPSLHWVATSKVHS